MMHVSTAEKNTAFIWTSPPTASSRILCGHNITGQRSGQRINLSDEKLSGWQLDGVIRHRRSLLGADNPARSANAYRFILPVSAMHRPPATTPRILWIHHVWQSLCMLQNSTERTRKIDKSNKCTVSFFVLKNYWAVTSLWFITRKGEMWINLTENLYCCTLHAESQQTYERKSKKNYL